MNILNEKRGSIPCNKRFTPMVCKPKIKHIRIYIKDKLPTSRTIDYRKENRNSSLDANEAKIDDFLSVCNEVSIQNAKDFDFNKQMDAYSNGLTSE